VDEEINAEIERLVVEAAEIAPRTVDIKALAIRLQVRFDHRSIEEIHERLKGEWRMRGLFWT